MVYLVKTLKIPIFINFYKIQIKRLLNWPSLQKSYLPKINSSESKCYIDFKFAI